MTLKDRFNIDGIVGSFITTIEPTIIKMMYRYKVWYLKEYSKSPSKFDLECTELSLVMDAVGSFEKYTQSSDNLIEVSTRTSPKGNIVIEGVIERDGTEYNYSTEVIYAGGYNIQRLHYRYITHTKLPKTSVNSFTKLLNERRKKMNKIERINEDIQRYKTRIENNSEDYARNEKLTIDERWEIIKSKKDYFEWPTWKEIVNRGADKNYDYSEDTYKSKMEEYNTFRINNFQRENIDRKLTDNIRYQREIEKLEKKLSKI